MVGIWTLHASPNSNAGNCCTMCTSKVLRCLYGIIDTVMVAHILKKVQYGCSTCRRVTLAVAWSFTYLGKVFLFVTCILHHVHMYIIVAGGKMIFWKIFSCLMQRTNNMTKTKLDHWFYLPPQSCLSGVHKPMIKIAQLHQYYTDLTSLSDIRKILPQDWNP